MSVETPRRSRYREETKMTRTLPLVSDETYDETAAFPTLALRTQVANRLADVMFWTDEITMLIDERTAEASRDLLDLMPQFAALYEAANDLLKKVDN